MEEIVNKESIEYLNSQIEKTLSEQKEKKGNIQKSFLVRNKKLIIFFSIILVILFISVNIYVNWGLNNIYNQFYNQR